MRIPALLAIALAALVPTTVALADDDAALLIGRWETVSDEPGGPWGYAEIQVTFAADGSGIEDSRIDGTETRFDFSWHLDPATEDGIMITLGAGEVFAIPLEIIDRDTIRISSPASADLPDHPMATFTRMDPVATQASQSPDAAGAQGSIPYTAPVIGMIAEYSNGTVMTVLDTPAVGETVIEESHPEWGVTEVHYAYGIEWLASTWYDEAGVTHTARYELDRTLVAQAWPLSPGYQISYVSKETIDADPPSTFLASLQVLEPQAYDGPAGTHDAGVVKLDIDLGGGERVVYVYWFVPGFALPVRLEITNMFADGTEAQDVAELVRVTYPD